MSIMEQSDYDRGRREAKNILVSPKFGVRAALLDLRVHLRSDRIPLAYTAGYADAVLEAVQR